MRGPLTARSIALLAIDWILVGVGGATFVLVLATLVVPALLVWGGSD